MAGRPRWWVAGLSLFLALVVGLVVWLTHRDSTYHAPLSAPTTAQASSAEASGLLRGLQTAVRRGEPAPAARLAAGEPAARTLAGVVRNGRALHVRGFSLRYVDQAGGVAPDGAFTAYVARLLAVRGLRPATGADGGPGPLRPARRAPGASPGSAAATAARRCGCRARSRYAARPSALVVVQGDAAEADRVPGWPRAAVPQVRRVLPGWRGHLVVEVPATEQRLEGALHADPASTPASPPSPPRSTARRRAAPRCTSSSTRRCSCPCSRAAPRSSSPTRPPTSRRPRPPATSPTWLLEGFADYVALRAQRLPLAHRRRPDHRPGPHSRRRRRTCPGDDDVRDRGAAPRARYESAWLACRLLADAAASRRPGRLLPRRRRRAARSAPRCGATSGSASRGLTAAVADPPGTLAGVTERRWALATFLVATVGLRGGRGLADPVAPGPRRHAGPARPADTVFTPAQIARANAYTDPARHLALGLARGLAGGRAACSASRRSAPAWSGGCGAGGGCACCWPCCCWR